MIPPIGPRVKPLKIGATKSSKPYGMAVCERLAITSATVFLRARMPL